MKNPFEKWLDRLNDTVTPNCYGGDNDVVAGVTRLDFDDDLSDDDVARLNNATHGRVLQVVGRSVYVNRRRR